jgi:hypothetical protein
MSRNLRRLSAYANRTAALYDFEFVYNQLIELEVTPPVSIDPGLDSAKQIDNLTRSMINFAKANKLEIQLPPGWKW